jgi:pyruvate ferredoxin oxidoreductase gamma subunit
MYQIRFHGRGGQGIKTASRILGTAFFLEDYEVQDAPRYGAERRGAPIFAYVRASKEPINDRGIIQKPDLVIVADDTLVPVPAAGVIDGVTKKTTVLINSHDSKKTWINRLNTESEVLILPITEESEDRAELPYIGATCAGAAACLLGIISSKSLEKAIRTELQNLGKEIIDKNLEHAKTAFKSMRKYKGSVTETEQALADTYVPPDWVDVPFEAAEQSAPVIHAGLTSVEVRTGLWRIIRPEIDYDRCNHCWWICSTFCPDSAINVSEGNIPEVDYDHCKGCMICVAICPSHAIEAVPETQAQQAQQTEGGKP